jgi:hypothetical protein
MWRNPSFPEGIPFPKSEWAKNFILQSKLVGCAISRVNRLTRNWVTRSILNYAWRSCPLCDFRNTWWKTLLQITKICQKIDKMLLSIAANWVIFARNGKWTNERNDSKEHSLECSKAAYFLSWLAFLPGRPIFRKVSWSAEPFLRHISMRRADLESRKIQPDQRN